MLKCDEVLDRLMKLMHEILFDFDVHPRPVGLARGPETDWIVLAADTLQPSPQKINPPLAPVGLVIGTLGADDREPATVQPIQESWKHCVVLHPMHCGTDRDQIERTGQVDIFCPPPQPLDVPKLTEFLARLKHGLGGIDRNNLVEIGRQLSSNLARAAAKIESPGPLRHEL